MTLRFFPYSFSRHFLRSLSLLVFVVVSAASLWASDQGEGRTATEAWVLSEVSQGRDVNLKDQKVKNLSVAFLEYLLTGKDSFSRPKVSIENAVITDTLRLDNREIPFQVVLRHCRFEKGVSFYQTTFKKGLNIQFSEFNEPFEMNGATVMGIMEARETIFRSRADFTSTKITGYISLEKATFDRSVGFVGAEIGNNLNIIGAKFLGRFEIANFETIKVGNDVFLRNTIFYGPAKFTGATINGNFEAHNAEFRGQPGAVDTRPRFDDMKFDGGVFSVRSFTYGSPPARFSGMEYRRLSVGKEENLLDLVEKAEFSADIYTRLEDFLQKTGEPEQADKIYIRMKRRERANLGWPSYTRSLLLDGLVAYGRAPERAFLWGGLVVLIGLVVFRRRSGMQAQDRENESRPYNAFWYSLDLFAPVINLQSANVWMPKQDRRFARNYVRIHRILGWILLPIGVAALTGLIK